MRIPTRMLQGFRGGGAPGSVEEEAGVSPSGKVGAQRRNMGAQTRVNKRVNYGDRNPTTGEKLSYWESVTELPVTGIRKLGKSSNQSLATGDRSPAAVIVRQPLRKHILPADLERYGIEESSHLSGVGMQDKYLAMQRFHVMSTRLVQSEERIAALETNATNYQKAEESWKLEKRKLSEQCNFAMAQVASLTTEKDSLAEKIVLLEKNEVTACQEAHEILSKEWELEFRREMKEAEKEYCFKLGCMVGFKSFLAKVENKFPNLDLSDISQFEPIEFDMKVIEDLDRVGNRRQTISTVCGRASTRKYNVGDVGVRYLDFFFKQLRSRERTTLLLSSFAGLDTI
ncbi:hypothetical protein ACLB2K_001257 [Fragaria x ananassa]